MKVAECVTRVEVVPSGHQGRLWDVLVLEPVIKERLMHQALLSLSLRQRLPFEVTALHGLITLYGPPGTGKTTLARGLAGELAEYVSGKQVRLVEISPHGLMSAEHGLSQQRVTELLAEHVPQLADDGMPTVVVLDEVESMTVARSAASLSANPADVHRATDAVLTALDDNAVAHPHLLTVATSNFTDALDSAFLSRSDAAILVPLPATPAVAQILAATLRDFAVLDPELGQLAESAPLLRSRGPAGRRRWPAGPQVHHRGDEPPPGDGAEPRHPDRSRPDRGSRGLGRRTHRVPAEGTARCSGIGTLPRPRAAPRPPRGR